MRTYVVQENIRRFEALIAAEASPERRRMLEGLLREEQQKLAALKAQASPLTDGGAGG